MSGSAQAEPLPRSRQADVRVRDAVGVLQLLAVPADLRREPRRRDAVHDRAHQPRLAVPGAVPRRLPLRGAVAAAAVARPQAHAAPPGRRRAVAAVHALRRPLHDGLAGVRRRPGRTCTCEAGEHESHFFVHWLDLAAPLAIGGLWLWMFFTQLRQRPLLAFGDPYLREVAGERQEVTDGRSLSTWHGDRSADDEYLATPPGSSYEHTDADVWHHRQVRRLAGGHRRADASRGSAWCVMP